MKALKECVEQFGRCYSMEVGEQTVVFRKPAPTEWRRFMSKQTTAALTEDGTHVLNANEALCQACILSHNPEELQAIEVEELNLFNDVAKQIAAVVKKDAELTAKKHEPASKTL